MCEVFSRKLCVSIIVFLLGCPAVFATVNDYRSSVYVTNSLYTLTDDTTSEGYGWYQAGIDTAGHTFTVDLVPPINGPIDMNSGSIVLVHDLLLGSDATLSNTGSIYGAGKAIFLSNDLTYSGTSKTLTIADDLMINGEQHSLIIGGSNSVVIASEKTLTLKNMTLSLTTSVAPFSLSSDSTLVLENVRVIWGSDTTFSAGALTISGNCSFTGTPGRVLTYTSAGSLTINGNSCLHLDHGFTLKHNYASTDNIVFTNRSSRLRMTGSTLESAARTLVLQTGTLITDHHSYLKGSGESGGITLGDDTDRLYIIFLPGATFDVNGGSVAYANAN